LATYTVQTITEAGLNPTYTAVGASDTFTVNAADIDKTHILHVKNAGGSSDSVSVDDPNSSGPAGATSFNPDLTVSVPNGGERFIRLLPARRYANTSTFVVTVTHGFTTSVTAAVFVA
jgi:hypothetical protein